MKYNILLADDDSSIRFVLSKYLTRKGYGVKATDNPKTLLKWTQAGEGHVILTDVHMGADEIFTFVPQLKASRPDMPIIVISANTRMVTALKSRSAGVFEYIPKPFELSDIEKSICRALNMHPKQKLQTIKQPDQIIGRSKAMQPVFKAISDYASGHVPVFIWGDAGTGKNLVAQCIHDAGGRADLEFVLFARYQNMSELLGAVGAGDLFIDRVHELSRERQIQLLGVLEQNEQREFADRFRVIVTAKSDMDDIRASGLVRPDLLSHLMGGRIYLPPLSERGDDVAELATHFLVVEQPKQGAHIHNNAIARLKAHSWPGNVRELRNLMQVIALKTSGQALGVSVDLVAPLLAPLDNLDVHDELAKELSRACNHLLSAAIVDEAHMQSTPHMSPHEQALEWIEKPLINEALRLTVGNNSKAADLLGIHRNTLRTKIRKWNE